MTNQTISLKRYERRLPDASQIKSTVCQFCAVGCGYRALLTPSDVPQAEGKTVKGPAFISTSMQGEIRYKGRPYNAAVVPDPRCDLNRGNHSVRGGSQALNLVRGDGKGRSTEERLVSPQVRCNDGKLHDITWSVANELVARLTAHVTQLKWESGKNNKKQLVAHNPDGLGVKIFEYQFLENTYAATKLFFRAIGTPNVAFHDRPSVAGSSPGLKDAGFRPHAFAYEDIRSADLLFLVGSNPYENQSVFFMQNCVGKEMIVLDPRCTATAQYAKDTGGIHLQPKRLGADPLVLYALARALLERFDDEEDLHPQIARTIHETQRRAWIDSKKPDALRRASRAMGLDEFKAWLGVYDQKQKTYQLENAAKESGIPLDDLQKAVDWMAKGPEGLNRRPVVGTLYEKGLIWGFNYHNTAAVASLGLVLWHPDQPAPLTGRCGGHQKGWAVAKNQVNDFVPRNSDASGDKGYPFGNASDDYTDELLESLESVEGKEIGRIKVQHNLDTHVFGPDAILAPRPVEGNPDRVRLSNGVETVARPDVQLLWIIGNNYLGQTHNAEWKRKKLNERRRGQRKKVRLPKTEDLSDAKKLAKQFIKRWENPDGLVVIHQEIYPNATTEFADIVLPAAGWGEDDFVRYNAERRLRLYERFQDSPLHADDAKRLAKQKDPDPHLHLDDHNVIRHSPKPDWLIFRDVAREMIHVVAKKSKAANEGLAEFAWANSSQVADEMAANSNRSAMLKPMLEFAGCSAIPGGQHIHTLLGLDQSGESKHLKTENGYSVPSGSAVLSNGVPSNGVLLPARTIRDSSTGQMTLQGTLRQIPEGTLNFVRADWCKIEPWFRSVHRTDPVENKDDGEQKGLVTLTCGRFNHLWNNLFSSSRNDFVTERFPADLPGTVLEVNPNWARKLDLDNGDVVEVTNKLGSFTAVVSRQSSVADGAAFALFSYPVLNKSGGMQFDGYANNLMHGYWDGMNPIGALKYGRAVIRKKKNAAKKRSPGHKQLSHASRNQIVALPLADDLRPGVSSDGRWHWYRRLDWRMRELIVTKGLPRAFVHTGPQRQASLLNPDQALRDLRQHWGAVFSMMLAAMQWPPPRREEQKDASDTDPPGRYDVWDGPDLDFARSLWGRSLEVPATPSEEAPIQEPLLDAFIAWSKFITGFDELDADRHHAATILRRLRAHSDTKNVLDTYLGSLDIEFGVLSEETAAEQAYRYPDLTEAAVLLWYTGAFIGPYGFAVGGAQGFGTMEDDHYRKALVWRAAGLQPQGYSTIMERWEDRPSSQNDEAAKKGGGKTESKNTQRNKKGKS